MRCHLQSSECRGRIQWHHVIKQQRLRREFKYGTRFGPRGRLPADRHDPVTTSDRWGTTLDDILGDTRNRIFLCSHHHELVTNHRIYTDIPDSVWAFCADYGLTAQLESDLRKAA